MEDIILSSKDYKVVEKNYKGKANGWKDLKVGDIIRLELKVEGNSSFGKVYQVYVKVNVSDGTNKTYFYNSFSKLAFMLSDFKLEEQ